MVELIILALMSAYIFSKLWQTLGSRPPDFGSNDQEGTKKNVINVSTKDSEKEKEYNTKVAQVNDIDDYRIIYSDATSFIKKHVKDFSWDNFLMGVDIAFRKIITSFADDDLKNVEKILDPNVIQSLNSAIKQRQDSGLKLNCDIKNVETSIINATTNDHQILIDVQILSDQQNTITNGNNEIVKNPTQMVHRFVDIWTFTMDIHTTPPKWIIQKITEEKK
jgi:predicted lipid-binding transport protein (Tim44 family)